MIHICQNVTTQVKILSPANPVILEPTMCVGFITLSPRHIEPQSALQFPSPEKWTTTSPPNLHNSITHLDYVNPAWLGGNFPQGQLLICHSRNSFLALERNPESLHNLRGSETVRASDQTCQVGILLPLKGELSAMGICGHMWAAMGLPGVHRHQGGPISIPCPWISVPCSAVRHNPCTRVPLPHPLGLREHVGN